MLNEYLVLQLKENGIEDTVVLQQDRTSALFEIHVRDYLNETFPGRWIGRGSASPAPFAWPPRSPDLTTPDNALWGFIKEQVRNTRYHTTQELRAAVEYAFTLVTPEYLRKTSARTWRRIQMSYDLDGVHTDVLDS